MPVELEPEAVARALARLGEHDLDAPRDVEGALEWIVGREDPEAPILLSRYELQIFLWYGLPRKWLVPLEEKQAVAARLGRFLELVGGRAAAYAEVCTSEQTMRLLEAWEEGADSAGDLLGEAVDASGLDPPDTDLLEWGSQMGPEEARLHMQVARELEEAVEGGRLVPGGRGFARRRVELVEAFLSEPGQGGGRARSDVIAEERIRDWAQRGSAERREAVAPIVPLLEAPADQDSLATGMPLAPLVWLLGVAADGIALTQTGALNRAFVRTAVERFPAWWEDRFGVPQREGDVARLRDIDELARRLRLLRRTGRKLLSTKRGQAAHDDPASLLGIVAPHLLGGEGFDAAVQELAAAVLLGGEGTIDRDEVEQTVHAAIIAEGWNADGVVPDVFEVGVATFGLIRLAVALELLDYEWEFDRESGTSRRELTVAPLGREALRLALRARAIGPARWP